MTEQKIIPEKVTKPIQLLAACLVGLILVNASFLVAAQQISKPEWAAALLVIAAVCNVPVFIFALFLLQTKFRPQMQEDSFYARYLENERGYSAAPSSNTAEIVEHEIAQTAQKIVHSLGVSAKGKEKPITDILRKSQHDLLMAKHQGSRSLAELYVSPKTWRAVVNKWGESDEFIRDIESLLEDGLAERKYKGYKNCRLTPIGIQIAKTAESAGKLFSQEKSDYWDDDHAELAEN